MVPTVMSFDLLYFKDLLWDWRVDLKLFYQGSNIWKQGFKVVGPLVYVGGTASGRRGDGSSSPYPKYTFDYWHGNDDIAETVVTFKHGFVGIATFSKFFSKISRGHSPAETVWEWRYSTESSLERVLIIRLTESFVWTRQRRRLSFIMMTRW